MTSPSPFIRPGARVQLPSGGHARVVRWTSRHINPENFAEGLERIAVVQIEGGVGGAEFSEGFIRLCKVLT